MRLHSSKTRMKSLAGRGVRMCARTHMLVSVPLLVNSAGEQ